MLFLFFVSVAFGFWVLQTLQQDFEITIPVKTHYKELPEEYAFVNQPADKINITIQDKGATLLNYYFSKQMALIEFDLSDSKNNVISFNRVQLQSIVGKQLAPTTRLIRMVPDSITIHYSKLKNKRLPVRFAGEILPAAGYMLEKQIDIEPHFIEVYAPKEIIDTLTSISTENIRIEGVSKKTKKTIFLNLPAGVFSKIEDVEISINVEEASEKRVEVPITIDQLPPNLAIKLFPPKTEVICRLPLSKFNRVSSADFKVKIAYSDIIGNKDGWVIAQITQQPDFVEFARLSPSRIEFILEVVNRDD